MKGGNIQVNDDSDLVSLFSHANAQLNQNSNVDEISVDMYITANPLL